MKRRAAARAPAAVARGLGELGAIHATLRERRAAVEAAHAAALAQAAKAEREQRLFAESVGQIIPLRRPPTPALAKPRPAPFARQRERDEKAALAESMSDGFDVETLLETDDALSFRRRGIGLDVVRKLRRGVWALQGQLDLHGLRRDEARERLAEFLRHAGKSGLRCVRVVHGKGNGSPGREPVLKGKVRSWLVQRSEVIAFTQARASEGGAGALVVLLKPPAKA